MANNCVSKQITTPAVTFADGSGLSTINFGTSDFSICFAMRVNSFGNVSAYVMTKTAYRVSLGITGTLTLRIREGATIHNITSPAGVVVADSKWHDYVISVNRNGTVYLYVDKTQSIFGNNPETPILNATDTGSLLVGQTSGAQGDTYSDFYIDRIIFYKKALSQAEVNAIWNKKYNSAYAGAASFACEFDEGTGITTVDAIAGTYEGIVNEDCWATGGVPFSQAATDVDLAYGEHTALKHKLGLIK